MRIRNTLTTPSLLGHIINITCCSLDRTTSPKLIVGTPLAASESLPCRTNDLGLSLLIVSIYCIFRYS